MWKLRHRNDDGYPTDEVKAGEEVVTFRGEVMVVSEGVGRPPHKPSSAGHIWVKEGEYYPSVVDCQWYWEGPEGQEVYR